MIWCEVVEFDHGNEAIDNTDFQIETAVNFPMLFNEFYDISQDSFKDMVDINWLRNQTSWIFYPGSTIFKSLWWEYRKEKLTASNFRIAVINKVEPNKKLNSLFYSSVLKNILKETWYC